MSNSQFPFSQIVLGDRLGDSEKQVLVQPNAEELKAIAKAYDITDISSLTADLTLKPWRKTGVRVVGKLKAKLQQTCIVTLEDFEQEFQDEIDRTLEAVSSRPRKAKDLNADGEIEIELESLDPPDVMIDGKIDLGALVCEQLALNLDPFPRKPGAEFEPVVEDDSEGDESEPSPFAALAKLKSNPEH